MTVWKFSIQGNVVKIGNKERRKLTPHGCNEPYKDRYWCPKMQVVSQRELSICQYPRM